MTNTKLNLFIYQASSVILGLTLIWFIASLDLKIAVIVTGLTCIQNLSKFLYVIEQGKEDEELLNKIQELLEKERQEKKNNV